MVYTDGHHLVADTLAELHEFAIGKLRFQPSWFQDHPRHPHYDLTTHRAARRAIEAGAIVISSRGITEKARALAAEAQGQMVLGYG